MNYSLSPEEERFCEAMMRLRNPQRAWFQVWGGVDTPASVCASRGHALMRNPAIKWRIKDMREALEAERCELEKITIPAVLRKFVLMAQADPNELISLRIGCCRYCHGDGHGYQWTERGFLSALAAWEALDAPLRAVQPMPDIGGGLGFDKTREPHPDCPDCGGEGVERVVARDTSELSEGAALLYQGVRVTKEGLEIRMADRMKAWENVARILGAFKDTVDLNANVKAAVQAVHQAVANPAEAQQAYLAMIANDGPGG